MHHHYEIVLPPVDDVESTLEEALAPFQIDLDLPVEDPMGLWLDYWSIGVLHFDGKPDICTVLNCPGSVKCNGVIFFDVHLKPQFIVRDEISNGVNLQRTDWNRTFWSALNQCIQSLRGTDRTYRLANTPGPHWRVVTVDFHT